MYAILVCTEFPTIERTEKIVRIPDRNRNTFSYQASLPRPISAEILIAKANILAFYRGFRRRDLHP